MFLKVNNFPREKKVQAASIYLFVLIYFSTPNENSIYS